MLYWKLGVSTLQWYVCAHEFMIGLLCASRRRHHYQTWFMRDYMRYIVFYYECESVWSLTVTVIKKHLALLQHTSQSGSSLWSHYSHHVALMSEKYPLLYTKLTAMIVRWSLRKKNSLTFMYFSLIKHGTIKIRVEQNSLHPYVLQSVVLLADFASWKLMKTKILLPWLSAHTVNAWHAPWHFGELSARHWFQEMALLICQSQPG